MFKKNKLGCLFKVCNFNNVYALCIVFILWLFIMGSVDAINSESSNLNSIDNNTDDLIKLKRKLELEKAEVELKKLKSSGSSEKTGNHIANAQTVVTGVAINHDGRKIAWLQFTDGGSLTVNIGSKIGKYTVSDITMNGVTLSYFTGRKKPIQHNVFLKRTYHVPEKPNNQTNNNINPFFTPSPVITGANTAGGNDMVPPIVPVR
jgi:hypothetical protein